MYVWSKEHTRSKECFKKDKPKLSCTKWWNLSKVSPRFFESSFCSKRRKSGRFSLKTFKILCQHLHLPISQRLSIPYISHILLLKDVKDFGPTVASANIPEALFPFYSLHPFTFSFMFIEY